MIKLFGGGLIVFCAFLWGIGKSNALSLRLEHTEMLCELVRFVRERISAFREPLPDIYAAFQHPRASECGLLEALREGCDNPMTRLTCRLSSEDYQLMRSFFQKLGSSDGDGEISLCTYTLDALSRSCEVQKSCIAQKSKLYRTIPALAAASAVILLV